MRRGNQRIRDISSTYETFCGEVIDKSVLHVGCAAHDVDKTETEFFLHRELAADGSDTFGVDILEREVEKLNEMGYDAAVADVQHMSLGQQFDVIVAGEIIEHLVNFDGFLTSLDDHLAPGGLIMFTTPNAMAAHWTILRGLGIEVINTEHTCWLDETTLEQLLNRYGFTVVASRYSGDCTLDISDPLFSL